MPNFWHFEEEKKFQNQLLYTVGAKSLHTIAIKVFGHLNGCRNVKHLLGTNCKFSIQGMPF